MKRFLIFSLCSLVATTAMTQSRVVFSEDFESGEFTTSGWANGWALAQSTTGDYWIVNPCADKVTPPLVSADNKVAYITQSGGNDANTYGGANQFDRQAHFYRDVLLSTDSIYALTFDWKSKGSGSTSLKISGSATSYTPTGGLDMTIASQIGSYFVGTGDKWQSATLIFTHTATEDRRLFFTWAGSRTTTYGPPPAVDNIRLTAYPKSNTLTAKLTAGSLKDQPGVKEKTGLTIIGTLNALDFAFMRDSMPVLEALDISGATIAAYTGAGGTLPDSSSYPANEIPQHAFYNGAGNAFLKTVALPTSPYTVGAAAFRECTGLTGSVDLSKATAIGRDAFRQCTGLTGGKLDLSSATSIGNAAFFYASSSLSGKFTEVTFSDNLTFIGDSAFSYALYNATGNLTIPAKVTSIGKYAFSYYAYGSKTTQTLTFAAPSELATIGDYAFNYSSYFSGDLAIPASVTSIGKNAFASYGSSLSSATLALTFAPSSRLTAIGESAFSSCSKFSGDLTLPDSVTSIGSSAFSGCSGFDGTLTLPAALTAIGSSAFYNCSNLTFPPVTIPLQMAKVESSTFNGCSKLTSVILHDGVAELGSAAFQNA